MAFRPNLVQPVAAAWLLAGQIASQFSWLIRSYTLDVAVIDQPGRKYTLVIVPGTVKQHHVVFYERD